MVPLLKIPHWSRRRPTKWQKSPNRERENAALPEFVPSAVVQLSYPLKPRVAAGTLEGKKVGQQRWGQTQAALRFLFLGWATFAILSGGAVTNAGSSATAPSTECISIWCWAFSQ